jgi:hypothetical protein
VYVTYFDEIKPNKKYGQTDYWLGALSIPIHYVPAVEDSVAEIAQSAFQSSELTRSTELHSAEIYFRNGNFAGEANVAKRLAVLEKLIKVFDKHKEIKKTIIRIIPENISYSSEPAERVAFMYMCEQVDGLMLGLKTRTLLVGDRDHGRTNSAIQEFLTYRTNGTNWARGKKLQRVVDSVYFTESWHSRMLQLADVYVFSRRVAWGSSLKGTICSDLRKLIASSSIDNHDRCRWWPTQPTWYRS